MSRPEAAASSSRAASRISARRSISRCRPPARSRTSRRSLLPGEACGEHDLVARCDELKIADREPGPAEHVEGSEERGQEDPYLQLVGVLRWDVDAERRRDV